MWIDGSEALCQFESLGTWSSSQIKSSGSTTTCACHARWIIYFIINSNGLTIETSKELKLLSGASQVKTFITFDFYQVRTPRTFLSLDKSIKCPQTFHWIAGQSQKQKKLCLGRTMTRQKQIQTKIAAWTIIHRFDANPLETPKTL